MHPICEAVMKLFARRGNSRYGGEAVTQEQHALQAATFALRAGASDALLSAALLHDVGHLLHNLPEDAPEQAIDDRHEQLGARWLERWFGRHVREPVRLHVDAKRYLCAREPAYYAALSGPSQLSLELQAGPMSAAEAAAFEELPYCTDAVALRRWDDAAKQVEMPTEPLAFFLPYVERAALERGPEA